MKWSLKGGLSLTKVVWSTDQGYHCSWKERRELASDAKMAAVNNQPAMLVLKALNPLLSCRGMLLSVFGLAHNRCCCFQCPWFKSTRFKRGKGKSMGGRPLGQKERPGLGSESVSIDWPGVRECEYWLAWGQRMWILTGLGSESVSIDWPGVRECEYWLAWVQRVWVLIGRGSESVNTDWPGIRECEYWLAWGQREWILTDLGSESVSIDWPGISKCDLSLPLGWDQRVWVLTGQG